MLVVFNCELMFYVNCKISYGRFYKFNLSLANSQNLIKATANVILLSQI